MKKTQIITAFVICCIILGCAPQLYIPSDADSIKQQQLLQGRKLYVSHCGSCHNLHLPKEYNAGQWENNIDKMQMRAKITETEKQLIFQYLISQH